MCRSGLAGRQVGRHGAGREDTRVAFSWRLHPARCRTACSQSHRPSLSNNGRKRQLPNLVREHIRQHVGDAPATRALSAPSSSSRRSSWCGSACCPARAAAAGSAAQRLHKGGQACAKVRPQRAAVRSACGQAAAAAARRRGPWRGRHLQTSDRSTGSRIHWQGRPSLAAHRFWPGPLRSAASWRLAGWDGRTERVEGLRDQVAGERRARRARQGGRKSRAGQEGLAGAMGRFLRCASAIGCRRGARPLPPTTAACVLRLGRPMRTSAPCTPVPASSWCRGAAGGALGAVGGGRAAVRRGRSAWQRAAVLCSGLGPATGTGHRVHGRWSSMAGHGARCSRTCWGRRLLGTALCGPCTASSAPCMARRTGSAAPARPAAEPPPSAARADVLPPRLLPCPRCRRFKMTTRELDGHACWEGSGRSGGVGRSWDSTVSHRRQRCRAAGELQRLAGCSGGSSSSKDARKHQWPAARPAAMAVAAAVASSDAEF